MTPTIPESSSPASSEPIPPIPAELAPAPAAAPVEEPRRKRGRPRKVRDEAPRPDELTDAIAGLYAVGFLLIAKRGGAHWLLTPDESKLLAEKTQRVIEYYFPDMPEFHPALGLGLAVGGVIIPRAMQGFTPPEPDPAPAPTGSSAPETPQAVQA